MRKRTLISSTAALLIAGTIVTAATPATAAPLPTSLALLSSAAPIDVVDVRVRQRSGGAGVGAGLIIGGLIASSPYHYGGPAYYYGPPGYYPPGITGPSMARASTDRATGLPIASRAIARSIRRPERIGLRRMAAFLPLRRRRQAKPNDAATRSRAATYR